MKSKILYILLGALLFIGYFLTIEKTIDQESLALIEKAQNVDTQKIWPGFSFEKYPLDVSYGKYEFHYDKGKISKQKNKLGIQALSAMPTEKGPVVKMLPLSQVRTIVDMGSQSKEEREQVYISILLHEAFHCYQMENGVDVSSIKSEKIDTEGKEFKDYKKFKNSLQVLDEDEEYQKLWEKEMQGLTDFIDNKQGQNWAQAKEERIAFEEKKLGKDFELYREWSLKKELLEGTARYVEDKALALLQGGKEESLSQGKFLSGEEKFYVSGSLKAQILDKKADWKKLRFDGSINLDQLLLQEI